MNSLQIPKNLIQTYLDMLQNLHQDSKLELIVKLSETMKSDNIQKESEKSLFGAFQSDESAEELIENLKKARVFNRKIEDL
jgi:hypothetical protein